MRLLLWQLTHSGLFKVILFCLISNIWMYLDGWYKSDEYYMHFSFKGPNTGSFLPFVPKAFSLIFAYYIIAVGSGGMAYATRYVPLIICGVIYLIIALGYFRAHKNKKWLYLMLFSAAFLLSTVLQYLLTIFTSKSSRSFSNNNNNNGANSYNNTTDNWDETISQQRESYYNNQAAEQARQAEVNANAMGFHSADQARQNGIEL